MGVVRGGWGLLVSGRGVEERRGGEGREQGRRKEGGREGTRGGRWAKAKSTWLVTMAVRTLDG